jgi:excisionase family DNA binding protein
MATEKMAFSVKETADSLGLCSNTVYELIQSGKLPAIHLGRKILVSKIELQTWLKNGNTPPAGTGTAN